MQHCASTANKKLSQKVRSSICWQQHQHPTCSHSAQKHTHAARHQHSHPNAVTVNVHPANAFVRPTTAAQCQPLSGADMCPPTCPTDSTRLFSTLPGLNMCASQNHPHLPAAFPAKLLVLRLLCHQLPPSQHSAAAGSCLPALTPDAASKAHQQQQQEQQQHTS